MCTCTAAPYLLVINEKRLYKVYVIVMNGQLRTSPSSLKLNKQNIERCILNIDYSAVYVCIIRNYSLKLIVIVLYWRRAAHNCGYVTPAALETHYLKVTGQTC